MSERLQTDDLLADDADRPIAREREDTNDPSGKTLEPLFDDRTANELRDRWHALQAKFVDDPRDTVNEADSLVAELLQQLAQGFNDARVGLEEQWNRGDDVSTEELRVTLQRYRSFFERLLSA